MWSFVGLKHNKQWIWLALDSDSREIVRHYGNHCHQSTVNAPFVTLSKKIENHIGAIWNFIHYYNSEIAPKLAITTY